MLVKRSDLDRVVMCELLVPDTPNVYGDIYTKESIKEFVEEFAKQGFGLDIDHDENDVQGKDLLVVESFIARPGDPDFIEGSWVVGMKILSDAVWNKVVSGELNGYSFQADCLMSPVVIENLANRQVSGITEPDIEDGHTHPYLVVVNAVNRPISGGTGITAGHSHRIVSHTITEPAQDSSGRWHMHRYQVIGGVKNDIEETTEGESNVGS